ncbi:hypothetical protein CAAN1_06S04522 [[Candida] anglica]|uniref:Uncharacterized protein n=1 Tax=[Candida] anglica TaxID=148631 RepID=A0ABP0EL68_9ASCO
MSLSMYSETIYRIPSGDSGHESDHNSTLHFRPYDFKYDSDSSTTSDVEQINKDDEIPERLDIRRSDFIRSTVAFQLKKEGMKSIKPSVKVRNRTQENELESNNLKIACQKEIEPKPPKMAISQIEVPTTPPINPTPPLPPPKDFPRTVLFDFKSGPVSSNKLSECESTLSLHKPFIETSSKANAKDKVSIQRNYSSNSSSNDYISDRNSYTSDHNRDIKQTQDTAYVTASKTYKSHRKANSLPEPDLDNHKSAKVAKESDNEILLRSQTQRPKSLPKPQTRFSGQIKSPLVPPTPQNAASNKSSSPNLKINVTTPPMLRRNICESVTRSPRPPEQDITSLARTTFAIQLRNGGDHKEASYHLKLAARPPNNYPHAMYLYAMALRSGLGVDMNKAKSLKWLLRCILVCENSTSNDFVSKLANLHTSDMLLAMNHTLKAEDRIDPNVLYEYYSKFSVSELAEIVESTKKNEKIEALTLHEVGNCLIYGWGVSAKDEESGMMYLEKASTMGSDKSMVQLGEIWKSKSKAKYYKKDFFNAAAWLRLGELFGQKSEKNKWIYSQKYIEKN